jgi:hypothetical protein
MSGYLHASRAASLDQLEQDAALFAGTPIGDSLVWAHDEIRRLAARVRELDEALSTAEWRMSHSPS